VTCAKMSKVPKSARCRKIGTREMTGMDWSVFAPTKVRILNLLRDGKSWSTTEVMHAIGAKSNPNVRRVLVELVQEGAAVESYEKRARHVVLCVRLAAAGRVRPVPKTVPAKRGRSAVGGVK